MKVNIINEKVFYKSLKVFIILLFIIINTNKTISYAYDGFSKYSKSASEYISKGDFGKALSMLSIGIAKYPSSGNLYYQRAVLYHDYLHDYWKAIYDYTKKLQLDRANNSEHAKIYYRRAVCKYKLGLIASSLVDYNEAISLSPRYDKAYFSRAKAYAKLGRLDLAINDLKMCSASNPKMAGAANSLLRKFLEGKGDF